LFPAIARTSVTGNGHWGAGVSGSVSAPAEELGLGLGLGLDDAVGDGEAVTLGVGVVVTLGVGVAVTLGVGVVVTLGVGVALSVAVADADGDGEIDMSREVSEADDVGSAIGDADALGDTDADALGDTDADELGDTDADALGDGELVCDPLTCGLALAEGEPDAEGSTIGSRSMRVSTSHSAGMPSVASSESVDAIAGVVPTREAMIAMMAGAMTMRPMRLCRPFIFITTPQWPER
jgi:hypothetical protein